MLKEKKILLSLIFLGSMALVQALPVVDTQLAKELITRTSLATQEKVKQAQEVAEAIQHTANQVTQLMHDTQNLVELGKDIADGNIFAINGMLNQVVDNQGRATSLIYDQNSIVTSYKVIFKKDPQAFENATGFSERSLQAMEDQVKKALQETNDIIYDTMSISNYSAKMKDDSKNLETLLNSAKTAQGSLNVLQVTSNMLGQQAKTVLDIRTLLETQAKLNASLAANELTVENADERINQESLLKMTSDGRRYKEQSSSFSQDATVGK